MLGEFGLLGVPSSAAAHGPGRRRPRPPCADPHQRRPDKLQAVLDVLRETSRRVGEILADGRVPLVLGGDCSVTIAGDPNRQPSRPWRGTGKGRRRRGSLGTPAAWPRR